MRWLVLVVAGPLWSAGVWSQELGDAAARERAKREKRAAEGAPRAPVFTDADLKKEAAPDEEEVRPGEAAGAPPSSRRSPSPEKGSGPVREKGSGPDSEPPTAVKASSAEEASSEEPGGVVDEWRRRAAEARGPLQEAKQRVKELEDRIAELREKLNPLSTKYVLGGLEGQDPNAVFAIQDELTSAETELAEARKALAEARESWERFVAGARAAGAPAAVLGEPDP
jgi:hypothetical protein